MKNPMRALHPGVILKEEYLAPLGLSVNALSKALHVTSSRINNIVLGKRGVTPDTALRLARYFGGNAQSWLNLQQSYDRKVAEKSALQTILKTVMPLQDMALAN